MLAVGAIGAYAGAKYAPNVLGKIDVDKALTRSAYTDVVHDRIAKLGDAGKDLFVSRRKVWFNEIFLCRPKLSSGFCFKSLSFAKIPWLQLVRAASI